MNFLIYIFFAFTLYISAQSNIKSLDSLIATYSDKENFYGNILIQKEGKTLYEKSIGLQNINDSIPNSEKTIYMVGNASKIYTAVIILKLIEQKKLKLSDKLKLFYPKIENSDVITIKMLLNHSSGLVDYTHDSEFTSNGHTPISKNDLIKKIATYPTYFKPESRHDYNNTNYLLLSFIAEKVSGVPYKSLLYKTIKKPLKLRYTNLGYKKNTTRLSEAYYKDKLSFRLIPKNIDPSWASGALGISTTLKEFVLFYEALFEGKIISKKLVEKIIAINKNDKYGLGISKFAFDNYSLYGTSGKYEGFICNILYNPKNNIVEAHILNAIDYNFNVNEMTIQLLNWIHKKPFQDFRPVSETLNADRLKAYEGKYSCPDFPSDIYIIAKDKQLQMRIVGESTIVLSTVSSKDFYFKPAQMSITFLDSDPQSFILYRRLGKHIFTRKQ